MLKSYSEAAAAVFAGSSRQYGTMRIIYIAMQRAAECALTGKLTLTVETIKEAVCSLTEKYHISRVTLFGSRADNSCSSDSDVDLIIEFLKPVSLLTISSVKCELEEILGLGVDIVHGPLRKEDMIEIKEEVLLYAA